MSDFAYCPARLVFLSFVAESRKSPPGGGRSHQVGMVWAQKDRTMRAMADMANQRDERRTLAIVLCHNPSDEAHASGGHARVVSIAGVVPGKFRATSAYSRVADRLDGSTRMLVRARSQ